MYLPVVSAMNRSIIFFFHKSYFLSKPERWIKIAIAGPWHHDDLFIRNNTKQENIDSLNKALDNRKYFEIHTNIFFFRKTQ